MVPDELFGCMEGLLLMSGLCFAPTCATGSMKAEDVAVVLALNGQNQVSRSCVTPGQREACGRQGNSHQHLILRILFCLLVPAHSAEVAQWGHLLCRKVGKVLVIIKHYFKDFRDWLFGKPETALSEEAEWSIEMDSGAPCRIAQCSKVRQSPLWPR